MSDSPAIVWIEKAELDRLRAENRALNEMLDAEKRAATKAVKAVTAENGDHLAWIEHLKAENERLRALLASTAQENPCQPQD